MNYGGQEASGRDAVLGAGSPVSSALEKSRCGWHFWFVTSLQGGESCLEPWEWDGKWRLCKIFSFWWPTAMYSRHRLQETLDCLRSWPILCHCALPSGLNRWLLLLYSAPEHRFALLFFSESLGSFHVLMARMAFSTEGWGLDHLINQVPANYGLLPVFVNEVSLEYSSAIYICDGVGSTVAGLGMCQRGHSICEAQILSEHLLALPPLSCRPSV